MANLSISKLRCPTCKTSRPLSSGRDDSLNCDDCDASYFSNDRALILLNTNNKMFDPDAYMNAPIADNMTHSRRRWLPSSSVNLSRSSALEKFSTRLPQDIPVNILVVGAGEQKSELFKLLGSPDNVQLTATDIDIAADVDYFCDGHDLPFADATFDGVITTAVLEHVLDPRRVSGEICRVTKDSGLLYSELPFMQQVHEGAYDFTRYSLSGHRWLFREYEVIDDGVVAGPGTALVWSLERFTMAFFNSSVLRSGARGITRLMFFWLKYFDYLTRNNGSAIDAASCTFVLSRKAFGPISEIDLVESYRGSQSIRHV